MLDAADKSGTNNEVTNDTMATVTADVGSPEKQKLSVSVSRIFDEAEGIRRFELRDVEGQALPEFTAGAHIEVHLPSGVIRSYSLCNDPAERDRYMISVLREEAGRGGSEFLHSQLRVGDTLVIAAPRNHFPLAGREARFHLLLAGGIGVTPMIAMIAELERRGARWQLHYCTRNAARTAFKAELQPFVDAGKVVFHHDDGDPARGLDIKARLSDFEIGTHLYFCGPPGFMQACGACLEAWPPHAVHREFFAGTGASLSRQDDEPFQVKLRRTGAVLTVPVDKTIVDVLEENGCGVETDCKEGYCGTCITKYLAGAPDHRDTVLSDKERKSYVMICCTRAKGLLELDL